MALDNISDSLVTRFRGDFAFLSNFQLVLVALEDELYPSVEHAYQAAKTLDSDERQQIRVAETPGKAKRLGRKVTLRPGWEEIKRDVMLDLLRQKFANAELRVQLLRTGDALLVEGNDWGDRYWGVCDGLGANHLGKLLMLVRAEIRAGA